MEQSSPSDQGRLARIFERHAGNVSYKWQQYIPVYETEFRRFVDEGKPVSLLEVGVLNGGSLQVWKEYLPAGSRVLGLDVNPDCARLGLGDGIDVAIGDATDADAVRRLLGDRTFAIIVDDGSHRCGDVIAGFANLFDRLEYGGIYVIEDCHASYWPNFDGGYLKPDSTIEWAKSLADAVNYDHIRAEQLPDELTRARLKGLNRDVARVAFYDSVVVIEKHLAPKEEPFLSFLSGEHMPVVDLTRLGGGTLRRMMFGPFILPKIEARLSEQLESEQERAAGNAAKLARSEARLKALTTELAARKADLARERKRNGHLSSKVRRLKASRRTGADTLSRRLLGWALAPQSAPRRSRGT